jgi:hypothetical protein
MHAGRLRRYRPSPAMVVALLALFVALSGTAVAAGVVPLAKRALVADNANHVGGKTAGQLTAAALQAATAAAAKPSSAAGLITVKSGSWSLAAQQGNNYTTACDAGQKAIAGGYDNPNGDALAFDNRPSADGASWQIFLQNLSSTAAASGTLYAVCLK